MGAGAGMRDRDVEFFISLGGVVLKRGPYGTWFEEL